MNQNSPRHPCHTRSLTVHDTRPTNSQSNPSIRSASIPVQGAGPSQSEGPGCRFAGAGGWYTAVQCSQCSNQDLCRVMDKKQGQKKAGTGRKAKRVFRLKASLQPSSTTEATAARISSSKSDDRIAAAASPDPDYADDSADGGGGGGSSSSCATNAADGQEVRAAVAVGCSENTACRVCGCIPGCLLYSIPGCLLYSSIISSTFVRVIRQQYSCSTKMVGRVRSPSTLGRLLRLVHP